MESIKKPNLLLNIVKRGDMNTNFSLNKKVRTRAERLEEEQKKQEELMQKQKEIAIEKARMLKRYMLAHATQQEGSRTEATIGKYNNSDAQSQKIIEEETKELTKDADNIMSVLGKFKLGFGKKKVIKSYMLNKLKDNYQ